MRCTTRDNISIAYDAQMVAGTTPLICVHGGGCNRQDFVPLLEALGDTRSIVRVDLRGHGESDREPGPFEAAHLAEDVLAVARALELEAAVLVVHSLGGPVALELLAGEELRVLAIVSIDSPLLLTPIMRETTAQLAQAYSAGMGSQAFGQFVQAVAGWADDPEAHTARCSLLLTGASEAVMGNLFQMVNAYDGSTTLAASSVPLLHIDTSAQACDLAALRALRPDAWVGIVVGSGHYPMVEVPEQVNPMITRFLRHFNP